MSKAISPGASDIRARPTPRAPWRRYEAARRRAPPPIKRLRHGGWTGRMDNRRRLVGLAGLDHMVRVEASNSARLRCDFWSQARRMAGREE